MRGEVLIGQASKIICMKFHPEMLALVDEYFRRAGDWLTYVSDIEKPYLGKTKFPYTKFTDGTFIWDSVIVFWVVSYCVAFPQHFLEHVVKQNGVFPHVAWDQALLDRANKANTVLIDRTLES